MADMDCNAWAQATIAVMQDGTVAIEADLCHALVQWPFLSDISLVWAAASIFQPESPIGEDPAERAAAEAAAQQLDRSVQQPWIYLNIVLRNSQLFLPVLDLVCILFFSHSFPFSQPYLHCIALVYNFPELLMILLHAESMYLLSSSAWYAIAALQGSCQPSSSANALLDC